MTTASNADEIIARNGPDAIVRRLAEFVSERRRARIESVLDGRMCKVHVAVEEPYDPHNAAAVVRSAEALGAGGVHVINAHARVLRQKKTTAGTFHWIETRDHTDLDGYWAEMGRLGMIVAGACVSEERVLESLPTDRPICLLFGNEHRGLSAEARERADLRFSIPISGFAESFNLSVSAAISLYSLLGRMRAEMGQSGDLEPEARARIRARWYLRSVDDRLAKGLFGQASSDAGEG